MSRFGFFNIILALSIAICHCQDLSGININIPGSGNPTSGGIHGQFADYRLDFSTTSSNGTHSGNYYFGGDGNEGRGEFQFSNMDGQIIHDGSFQSRFLYQFFFKPENSDAYFVVIAHAPDNGTAANIFYGNDTAKTQGGLYIAFELDGGKFMAESGTYEYHRTDDKTRGGGDEKTNFYIDYSPTWRNASHPNAPPLSSSSVETSSPSARLLPASSALSIVLGMFAMVMIGL